MSVDPKNTQTGELARILKRIGPAGPLAIVAATMPAVGGFVLLYYTDTIANWLVSHRDAGVVIYTVAFAVLAGFALLPTYAQAVVGGWAFKFTLGLPAALLGFTGGALIGYLIGRRASGSRVVEIIEEKPKWRAIYNALLGGGFWRTLGLVTLLRIPPNSPFAITNLVMAATRVPLVPYLIGTAIGMTPRTAIVIWWAAQLKDLADAEKPWWVFVVSIVLLLAVLAVFSQIANKAVAKVTQNQEPDATEAPAEGAE